MAGGLALVLMRLPLPLKKVAREKAIYAEDNQCSDLRCSIRSAPGEPSL